MTNSLFQLGNMNFRICNDRPKKLDGFYHDHSINLKPLLDTIDIT